MCSSDLCKVLSWTTWNACSKTCGGGTTRRVPANVISNKYGGDECPTHEEDVCNTHKCPVDCVMGLWSKWSECTVTCGHPNAGYQTRKRSSPAPLFPKFGGAACQHTQETMSCLRATGKTLIPCPIDCVVGAWSSWSACDVTCGSGISRKTRSLAQPEHGGKACPVPEIVLQTEPKECHLPSCDCKPHEWNAWTTCSLSCGGGTQTRTPKHSRCDASFNSRVCNAHACPKDCVVEPFSSWSACDKHCLNANGEGPGAQFRTRKDVSQAQNGGVPCSAYPKKETRSCLGISGLTLDTRCPIDGVCGTYTAWSTCSTSCNGGTSTRTRSHVAPQFGGKSCAEVTTESKVCNTHNCPLPCSHKFEAWETCTMSCGGGSQISRVTILKAAEHGGFCPGDRVRPCNGHTCPVDCKYGRYSAWTTCTASCTSKNSRTNPTQTKTRTVTQPVFGGKACGASIAVRDCNTHACPINCVLETWSDQVHPWTQCSEWCGTGFQTRKRAIEVQRESGGTPCIAEDMQEQRNCFLKFCPVDCVIGQFSAWSQCTKSCSWLGKAPGAQSRSRRDRKSVV